MNELHLFSGAGGGILGGMLLGHATVCAVEIEPYCRRVLLQRQRDGILPKFPIWDDVRTFDGGDWRGKVDVICGGFPCQDISVAGPKLGIDGKRSGLWKEMRRIIGEVEPSFVFLENSPNLTILGATRVIADLAKMGYVGRSCVLGSCHAGACFPGERFWALASKADSSGQPSKGGFHYAKHQAPAEDRQTDWFKRILQGRTVPYVCREDHEMADGMDRLTALGNGQDPVLAATAWRILSQ